MASHSDIANRWADVHAGTASRYLTSRGNVFVHADKLYSYGTHFELARFVKPKQGTPFYLLNGDTYSVTTSRHQRDIRAAVERHADKFRSVIIPYSAIDSAGIERDSIVPIHVEDERTEKTAHRVTVPGLVTLGDDAASGRFGWSDSETYSDRVGALTSTRELRAEDGTRYSVTALKRGWDYSASAVNDCGACEGTGTIDGATCGNPSCVDGKVTREYGGAWREYDPPRVSYYRNGSGLTHVSGDTFTYDTWRHFLGASVFAATVRETVERPCPNHVERESDSWCETCHGHVDHYAVSGETVPGTLRQTRMRRAFFLSAFDLNESRPHYFLAELPARWDDSAKTAVRPTSVVDALRYLMPAKVRAVNGEGPEGTAVRQGDIFGVPADDIAARYPIAFRYPETAARLPLDGTGRHIVSELVKLTSPDGRTVRYFARGTMRHPEHKRVKLAGWHEVCRNLVPRTAARTRGHNARAAMGAGTVRAWSIIGRVD